VEGVNKSVGSTTLPKMKDCRFLVRRCEAALADVAIQHNIFPYKKLIPFYLVWLKRKENYQIAGLPRCARKDDLRDNVL
jgi:hypothetical protein